MAFREDVLVLILFYSLRFEMNSNQVDKGNVILGNLDQWCQSQRRYWASLCIANCKQLWLENLHRK